LKITFDGDKGSLDYTYSEEGIEEVDAILSNRETYLSPSGGFKDDLITDTIELVLYNLTGDPL
jgi:hypothetical protein